MKLCSERYQWEILIILEELMSKPLLQYLQTLAESSMPRSAIEEHGWNDEDNINMRFTLRIFENNFLSSSE